MIPTVGEVNDIYRFIWKTKNRVTKDQVLRSLKQAEAAYHLVEVWEFDELYNGYILTKLVSTAGKSWGGA